MALPNTCANHHGIKPAGTAIANNVVPLNNNAIPVGVAVLSQSQIFNQSAVDIRTQIENMQKQLNDTLKQEQQARDNELAEDMKNKLRDYVNACTSIEVLFELDNIVNSRIRTYTRTIVQEHAQLTDAKK